MQSLASYAELLDELSDPYLLVNAKGEPVYLNKAAEHLLADWGPGNSQSPDKNPLNNLEASTFIALLRRCLSNSGWSPGRMRTREGGHADGLPIRGKIISGTRGSDPLMLVRIASEHDVSFQTLNEKLRGLNQELTLRLETNRKLQDTLDRLQVIMREVNHRTRNNMQLILSFINRERTQIKTPETIEVLNGISTRIYAIAAAHIEISQLDGDGLSTTNLALQELLGFLNKVFGPQHRIITEDIDEVLLRFDRTITMNMIAHEAIVNAIRYAYADAAHDTGTVTVSLRKLPEHENMALLRISDHGCGLPADMDLNDRTNLQVIKMLSKQLQTELNIESAPGEGTSLSFRFATDG